MQRKLNGQVASIQVRSGSEALGVHRMADGTSLIVGSDENCGLSLENDAIAAKHCVLRMAKGELFINDWYSETGTLVNGEKIYVETKLDLRDRVSIGTFELRFSVTSAMNVDEARFDHVFNDNAGAEQNGSTTFVQSIDAEAAIDEGLVDVEQLVASVRSERAETVQPEQQTSVDDFEVPRLESRPHSEHSDANSLAAPTAGDQASYDSTGLQLAAAREEIKNLKSELEYQVNLNAFAAGDDDTKNEFDPMTADDSELMRAEIEHLQRELETREEEIQQLISGGASAGAAPSEDFETEKLVGRLEQLLAELDESDRRAKSLETMLQASDDATEAECEERRQLETWVSEIEDRVIAREQQWKAAEEKLLGRLSDSDKLCRRLSANLQTASKGKTAELEQATHAIVTELTDKNNLLGDQLESTTVELERLKQLMEDSNMTEDGLSNMKEQTEMLRCHEVEMAQERAQMARKKAELVRLREELEASQKAIENASEDNPDIKVRAFRQHLQQIHEEEKSQQQKRRGLASRIANIWNRLEDR